MSNKQFFEKYQGILLWIFNTRIGRWYFRITPKDSSLAASAKVTRVLPNAIEWSAGSKRVKSIIHPKKGLISYNKSLRWHRRWLKKYGYKMPLLDFKTIEFRTHNRFAKRLDTLLFWIPSLTFYRDVLLNWRWRLNFGLTVTTFFPDPNPTTTSVDGFAGRNNLGSETLATLRGGAGTEQATADAADVFLLDSSGTSPEYARLRRMIFLFDTSAIGRGQTINSAIFSLYITAIQNGLSGQGSANSVMVLVASTPASNTSLANADYGQLGATDFGRSPTQANLTLNAYNNTTVNASGLTNISKTAVSKFGTIWGWDFDNTAVGITWIASDRQSTTITMADTAGTTQDPKLAVTYSNAGGTLLSLGVGQ